MKQELALAKETEESLEELQATLMEENEELAQRLEELSAGGEGGENSEKIAELQDLLAEKEADEVKYRQQVEIATANEAAALEVGEGSSLF